MKCTMEPTYTIEGMKEIFDFCLMDQQLQDELQQDWLTLARELDINDEVIHHAVTVHLPQTKDIRYKGIRMAIGGILRELCGIGRLRRRLAAGEDVPRLYGVMPVVLAPYQAIKYAGGDDVYVSFPDLVLMEVMQQFFHHAEHLFEKAEENGFSYGARHCALNKMGVAGRLIDTVPDPTVMWSWGLVCDEATKLDEFLKYKRNGSWTSVITRYPHDTYWDDTDYEDRERIHYLGQNLHNAIDACAEAMGVTVTQEDSMKAVEEYNKYMRKAATLGAKLAPCNPSVMRNNTMSLVMLPATIPFNEGLEYMGKAVDMLISEIDDAVADGYAIAPKDTPRVGMYFNPSNNPWFEALLNKNGVIVSMSMSSTQLPHQQAPSKFDDPYDQMAEQWQHMNFGMGCGCDTRDWVEKIRLRNCDAMIAGFLDYDRWLGTVQKVGAQIVEKELGIPTFYLEADFYDDRDYSEEALKTRVETMCQIIKMNTKKRRAKAALEAAAKS